MKLNHIGIVVSSIEKEKIYYEFLGYTQTKYIEDDVQNNYLCFMQNVATGEVIELIEPMNESSTVYNLPKGLAHMCYETEDIEESIKQFKEKKIGIVFTNKIIAKAFDNNFVVFLYLRNKTVIELVEIKG